MKRNTEIGLFARPSRLIQMIKIKQNDWLKITILLWVLMMSIDTDLSNAQTKTADNPGPIVSKVVVDVQDATEDKNRWVEVVKNLIFIREGERFSTKQFKNSLDALKSPKIFEAIHVFEKTTKEDRLELHFQVTPYPRVKDIIISGAFPLLEQEILNAMQLRAGDAYYSDVISGKEDAVVRLFKNQGYIAPIVNLDVKKDPTDRDVVIFVNIDKGDFYHIRQFEIRGNQVYSEIRLKFRTKTYKSWLIPNFMRRFKTKEFEKDIKSLIQFYRKKGYPNVVVNSVVNKDDETQNVSVIINIDEGPRYDFEFQGNTEFWDFTLKKDLILFKEGNKNDFGIKKSMRNIKKRYLDAGYKECRIEMESENVQESGRSVRKIRVIIQEGPQYIVNSVNIKGNTVFDSKKIKKQMLTSPPGMIANGAFVQETLEEDKRAIKSLYLKQGYMSSVVKDQVRSVKDVKKRKQNLDITIEIKEGVKTHVKSLTFHGLDVLSDAEAREAVTLKEGSDFRSYMIRSDENILSSMISEKGYPHIKVKGTSDISKDNTEAFVTYEVDEGPFVKMGQIAYIGNFFTKKSVVQDEFELEPGEPFSLKKFLRSHRNIRNINAFESVHFNTFGLKKKEDKVNLLLELEEKKPYYFQTGGGYDTDRGFYANILAGDRNLLGLNKDIWAGGEISQIGYRGDLGISEPRFWGTRIKSTINMFGETREEFNTNFGTRQRGVSLSFNRKFPQKFNADLSFVYSYRKDYPRDSESVFGDEENRFESREILTISPSVVYNAIDSIIRPRKGLYSSLLLDISKGIDNSLDDFFRYRFEIRKYYAPMENLSFALRGRVGDITPFEDASTIPEDQLFFLGGTSSVRGFDENLLRFDSLGNGVGGLTSILGNIETRIDVGPDIELSFFYDIGSVRNARVDKGSDEFRSSAGIGLHYFTPIGPIGAYYGHKLDRKSGESAGRFHFTIGFRF